MKRVILSWAIVLAIIGLGGFMGSQLLSESEKILAKVGDKVITQKDLDETAKGYESMRRGNPYNLQEKKDLLNNLVRTMLLVIEAEKEKMDEKPEFQVKLKLYKDELLAREFVAQKIEPLVTVTDKEVEEMMRKNPNLVPKEVVTFREIVVKTEKEAEGIYWDLKKGADFSVAVAAKSISQSKLKGGLVGPVTRGYLPPPVETVVFSLKEGEFSKPIKTEEGFQIVSVVKRQERSPEETKALEAKVREKVFQLEKNKKTQVLLEGKLEELKKQAKVEIYLDQLQ